MHYSELIRPQIGNLPVYQPGKPVELLCRQYGMSADAVVKLASNENPLGPSETVLRAIMEAARGTEFYPDNSGYELTREISATFGWDASMLTLGAGSNEIFYLLCDVFGGPGTEVVVGEFAFISYRIAALLSGADVVATKMPGLRHDLSEMRDAITERTRLIFLPNPNNPTGTALPIEEVDAFARSLPEHVIFCYDEAYAEYSDDVLDVEGLLRAGVKLISTRTFSKIHALAGLRIGYSVSSTELADLLNRVRPPFNTSTVAQKAAVAALRDTDFIARSREVNEAGRHQLEAGLARLGLETFGTHGNFVLFETEDADALGKSLLEQGVIVRPLTGYGLPRHIRVSIGLEGQNARFLEALNHLLK